jgi:hypothetical protein
MKDQAKSALPTQVVTWLTERSGYDEADLSEPALGEWLYCLKNTRPGDRQVVWAGTHGAGIVGVVDFGATEPRLREDGGGKVKPGRYEAWGAYTPLAEPIPIERLQADPALAERFAGSGLKALIGPISLTEEQAVAIDRLAGGLPPAADPGAVDEQQAGGSWSGSRLPPEVITEVIVHDRGRVARRLGFRGKVDRQKVLGNGKRPDLWCREGVVGEVKNLVGLDWGPAQLEGYLAQCDRQWPQQAPWKGRLIQGQPELAGGVRRRLEASSDAHRIELWAVTERRFPRRTYRTVRLFP